MRGLARSFPSIDPAEITVILAQKILAKRGVEIRFNVMLDGATFDGMMQRRGLATHPESCKTVPHP